jgi:hypothetical protein
MLCAHGTVEVQLETKQFQPPLQLGFWEETLVAAVGLSQVQQRRRPLTMLAPAQLYF